MSDQNNQNNPQTTAIDTNIAINEAELMALDESDVGTYIAVLVKQRNDSQDRESVLKTKVLSAHKKCNLFSIALSNASKEIADKDEQIANLTTALKNLEDKLPKVADEPTTIEHVTEGT